MESTQIQPRLTAPARVVAAFVAPTRLFQEVLSDSSWWLAWVLMAVVGLGFCAVVQKQVGWPRVYETILHQTPKQEERIAAMPPDGAANAKALGAKFTSVAAYATPVLTLVIAAIAAGVLLGTLNFGFGGHARFGALFAVYIYASLPLVVHGLLSMVTLFAGLDASSFLISNPLGSNLGYYLSADTPRWIVALATSFDVFTFWQLGLLILGCSIVAKVSRGAAATAVLGWWVLMLVLKVGGAVMQG